MDSGTLDSLDRKYQWKGLFPIALVCSDTKVLLRIGVNTAKTFDYMSSIFAVQEVCSCLSVSTESYKMVLSAVSRCLFISYKRISIENCVYVIR